MAGTIPLSLTQQFDELGNVLAGGKLFLIQAGTVATPQNGYQDSALTLPWPNPIILDAAGRLPQFFLADGSIKVRLTDALGVEKLVADGILVTGASSGGGGGSPVDATTVLATGDVKVRFDTGVLSGFVRCNGRTIGSASSGATERANADTQALFQFLWQAGVLLNVSGGRGASAAADWASNKTIELPDVRGRGVGGLDDMGTSAAGRLTASFFGAVATVLGAAGGAESQTLTAGQLPSITSSVNTNITSTSNVSTFASGNTLNNISLNSSGSLFTAGHTGVLTIGAVTSSGNLNVSNITSNNTGGTAHNITGPLLLFTIYLKL